LSDGTLKAGEKIPVRALKFKNVAWVRTMVAIGFDAGDHRLSVGKAGSIGIIHHRRHEYFVIGIEEREERTEKSVQPFSVTEDSTSLLNKG
jgi:hypothetical protein